MQIHNVTQGSTAWLALKDKFPYSASVAPSMLGCGKYMSRDELLDKIVTGIREPVSEFTQKLFDKGHAAEASIRPHIEKLIGADLYPVTGTETIDGLTLLASFDGLTMASDVVFEHKLWNDELARLTEAEDLPEYIRVQLEQQLVLADAEKAIFVVSDGTPENMVYCWYEHDPGLFVEIIQGWKQFVKDLSDYQPTVKTETPEATPVQTLPAINYKLDGLAITSNLEEYHEAANDLVEASKRPMNSDQDFADADARNKAFKKAEDNISVVCDQVIGEIQDVDKFRRDLMSISALLRQARLNGEKAVKTRKDEIRNDFIKSGQNLVNSHVDELNNQFNRPYIPAYTPDFYAAIKGKKNLDSIGGAINDLVAKTKIDLNDMASRVHMNTKTLNELATDHKFLFNDLKDLIFKDADDFRNLVTSRISDYQAEQARRQEEERVRADQSTAVEEKVAETGSPEGDEPEKKPDQTEARQVSYGEARRLVEKDIVDSLVELGIGKRTADKVAGLIMTDKIIHVFVKAFHLAESA